MIFFPLMNYGSSHFSLKNIFQSKVYHSACRSIYFFSSWSQTFSVELNSNWSHPIWLLDFRSRVFRSKSTEFNTRVLKPHIHWFIDSLHGQIWIVLPTLNTLVFPIILNTFHHFELIDWLIDSNCLSKILFFLAVPVSFARQSLNDYLRSHLQLTGTKVMCREGGCGACTVHVAYPDFAGSGEIIQRSINSVKQTK